MQCKIRENARTHVNVRKSCGSWGCCNCACTDDGTRVLSHRDKLERQHRQSRPIARQATLVMRVDLFTRNNMNSVGTARSVARGAA